MRRVQTRVPTLVLHLLDKCKGYLLLRIGSNYTKRKRARDPHETIQDHHYRSHNQTPARNSLLTMIQVISAHSIIFSVTIRRPMATGYINHFPARRARTAAHNGMCSLSRNFVNTTPLLLLVRNTIQLLLVVIVVASKLSSRDPKPALATLHVSVFHMSVIHVRILAREIDTLAVGALGAALR